METVERKAYSVKQFQQAAGLGKNSAYGILNQPGGVRALRVGKKWVIPVVEVDRWLAQAGQ
jgi:uncharacterized protein YegJ (DUF2314 family)